jgi:hypothetical protein
VLRLAKEAGLIQLGVLATDGTKMAGDASRHKAMSYGYMVKEMERLRAEIAALVQQAQDLDASEDAVLGSRRGEELPDELARREQRLATIEAAKKRLEAEAQAEAEAERQRRAAAEAQRQRTGQKRRGREPGPIDDTPDAGDGGPDPPPQGAALRGAALPQQAGSAATRSARGRR